MTGREEKLEGTGYDDTLNAHSFSRHSVLLYGVGFSAIPIS